jgi:hypothetical protein
MDCMPALRFHSTLGSRWCREVDKATMAAPAIRLPDARDRAAFGLPSHAALCAFHTGTGSNKRRGDARIHLGSRLPAPASSAPPSCVFHLGMSRALLNTLLSVLGVMIPGTYAGTEVRDS